MRNYSLIILAVIAGGILFPARANALAWRNVPDSVAPGAAYTISAGGSNAAHIELYKNGVLVASASTSSSPYGYNYEYYDDGCGGGYSVEIPYGCIISRSFSDQTGGAITYEARDNHGTWITHIVTITGANDPVAQITVDGQNNGASVLLPTGGSLSLTVRFTATDVDGDLKSIRPNKWNATANQLDNNNGAFVTVSGSSAEVARTYTINTAGDYYFWSEARDSRLHSNGTHVSSGAYQNGFHISVRDASKPEMNVDFFTATTTNGGQITCNGWAVDFEAGLVQKVELFIDGYFVANATLGGSRPDVAAHFGRPDFTTAGFSISTTVQGLALGNHLAVIRATSQAGATQEQSRTFTVRPVGKDALIQGVNSWPSEGVAVGHYGYGLGSSYPGYRRIWDADWGPWTNTLAQDNITNPGYFNLQQNPDGSISYNHFFTAGDRWRGGELVLYIKDPVTRWFLEIGHYQWIEIVYNDGCNDYYGGTYEWVGESSEMFETQADLQARAAQLAGAHDTYAHSTTYEWRVIHDYFKDHNQTTGGTWHSGTASFAPSWYGKEITARGWTFRGTHDEGNRIHFRTPGQNYTLTVPINPDNHIEILNTGPIYRDTSISLKITVTPPADHDDYTYGMRVRKWTGAADEIPATGGTWVSAPVHEVTTPLSEPYTWIDTAQSAAGAAGKIIYRLFSWQHGSPEEINSIDYEIAVANRAPASASILLSRTEIEYGQNVTVTGSLQDVDGDLKGHSLWVIAPTADGSKNPVWDCYSRPLDPDWWGDPRISENGWSGPWLMGRPSSDSGSTVTGIFTPLRPGIWQLHTNGCDTSGAWGPGDTKDLAVTKATPVGTFTPKGMGSFDRLSASLLDAVFRNPHAPSITLSGSISYTLNGGEVPIGQFIPAGVHILRAIYSGDDYHHAASVETLLTVIDDAGADNDGDGIPNGIEAALGTDPATPGGNPDNALGLKHLTPVED